MSQLNFLKKMDKNTLLIAAAIVGILVTGVLILGHSNGGFSFSNLNLGLEMSDNAIGKKAVDYINNNGLSSTPATLVAVARESGLVKVTIKIGTSQFDSYATPDGKFLFPQAFKLDQKAATGSTASATTTPTTPTPPANLAKTDNPMLQVYVVSRCPYGLQMQRAMSDAVQKVPSLAKYIELRYIGSVGGSNITAMHGDAEAQENLRQICIRDEQPAKFWNYIACQIKSGDTSGCEKSTGVDSAKLNACTADKNRGVAYAQKDFALDAKYNIQGSPTMVLDGANISESDFGGRSSDSVKSMICAAFNTKPSFCTTKLTTDQAATAFSLTYSGGGSSGSGSSGSTGSNCAPAQ